MNTSHTWAVSDGVQGSRIPGACLAIIEAVPDWSFVIMSFNVS